MTVQVLLAAPNQVTHLRLALVLAAAASGGAAALLLFAVSFALDALDGWLARQLGQESAYGAWCDVAVDIFARSVWGESSRCSRVGAGSVSSTGGGCSVDFPAVLRGVGGSTGPPTHLQLLWPTHRAPIASIDRRPPLLQGCPVDLGRRQPLGGGAPSAGSLDLWRHPQAGRRRMEAGLLH